MKHRNRVEHPKKDRTDERRCGHLRDVCGCWFCLPGDRRNRLRTEFDRDEAICSLKET